MSFALLIDLDGTLVDFDVLDSLCELVGKKEESRILSRSIGVDALAARINMLCGLRVNRIREVIEHDPCLDSGASEFITWTKQHQITTILNSGNLTQVLECYQEMLGIDHVVGSNASIVDGRIAGISRDAYASDDFKLQGCREILTRLSIPQERVMAIGNSTADIPVFTYCGRERSIAKRPEPEDAEQLRSYVGHVVENLSECAEILKPQLRSG